MIETINRMNLLVPLDFSPASLTALDAALQLAADLDASVTLIQVVEHTFRMRNAKDKNLFMQTLPQLMRAAKENLERHASKKINETGLAIHTVVKSGIPADEICVAAALLETNLIVMSTQGLAAHTEGRMGSTARRLMDCAPCSMLTMPPNHTRIDFTKILIPILWTPQVLDKFNLVRQLVKINHARVVLVGMISSDEPHELRRMTSLLDFICGRIAENQGSCQYRIYRQKIGEVGLGVLANRLHPGLLVMTSAVDKTARTEISDHPAASAWASVPVLSLCRNPQEMAEDTPMAIESSVIDLIKTKIDYFEKRPRLSKGR
jgi:nucleotide-binding universal stress UspA family protein